MSLFGWIMGRRTNLLIGVVELQRETIEWQKARISQLEERLVAATSISVGPRRDPLVERTNRESDVFRDGGGPVEPLPEGGAAASKPSRRFDDGDIL